ncbi:MAG: hypothetical protein ABR543_12025, partial [Gemmatimonadaceae bacterium]
MSRLGYGLEKVLPLIVLLLGPACDRSDPPDAPTASSKAPGAFQTSAVPSAIPNVEFKQFDIHFDNRKIPLSQWGAAELQFIGTTAVPYFNLTVDGVWRVQNMPVPRSARVGTRQTVSFNFDLGVAPGTKVNSVRYAFRLTSFPLDQKPQGDAIANVLPMLYRLTRGTVGGAIVFRPPSGPLVGGVQDDDRVVRDDMPNQDSKDFECVPVAASNSVQWLNSTHNLGLTDFQTSIEHLRVATGWTPAGVNQRWVELKDEHFKAESIPISTDFLTRFDLAEVLHAMQDGCDVELSILTNEGVGHTMTVMAVEKMNDGKTYTLGLRNDRTQGVKGGMATEIVKYDTETHRFTGAPWLDGTTPEFFTVE